MAATFRWSINFLETNRALDDVDARALIILNQPFSPLLLRRLWANTGWRCCADGGANRLHDLFDGGREGERVR